jgi:hypothetical protein
VSRALVLSLVALGVPAFGIYATITMPLTSVVSTRTIRNPPLVGAGRPHNATIDAVAQFLWTFSFFSSVNRLLFPVDK